MYVKISSVQAPITDQDYILLAINTLVIEPVLAHYNDLYIEHYFYILQYGSEL